MLAYCAWSHSLFVIMRISAEFQLYETGLTQPVYLLLLIDLNSKQIDLYHEFICTSYAIVSPILMSAFHLHQGLQIWSVN